jgi:thiamine pyrophosphokinase
MIVGSGEDFSPSKIKEYAGFSDFIIAGDGGLNTLDKLNIKPDLIVGDLDSVDKNILKKYSEIKTEIFPVEKDLTDSEIALQKAIFYNPENIFLFGLTGSYFDHAFANILNLFRNYNEKIEINIITSNSRIFTVKNKKTFKNLKGRRFSFFPLGNISGFSMEGFKYSFGKDNISFMEYSVSNVIIKDFAEIKFEKGILFCILFDEGYN